MARKLAVVLLVSGLVLVGCARKKDAPARGTVIGSVTMSTELAAKLNIDPANHCLQAVELNSDKSRVIEISAGSCPAEGVAPNVIATLKLWGEGEEDGAPSLGVMGENTTLVENTPVAEIQNDGDEKPTYEITQLCTRAERLEFDKYCKVKASAKKIDAIEFSKHHSLTRVLLEMHIINEQKIAAAEAKLLVLENRLTQADTDITAVEKRIDDGTASANSLSGLVKSIEDRVTALKAEKDAQYSVDAMNKLAALEGRVYAVRDELAKMHKADAMQAFTALETAVGKVKNDLADLKKPEVKALLDKLTADIAKLNTDLTAVDAKAVTSGTNVAAVETKVAAVDKSIKDAEIDLKAVETYAAVMSADVVAKVAEANKEVRKLRISTMSAGIELLKQKRADVVAKRTTAQANQNEELVVTYNGEIAEIERQISELETEKTKLNEE